MRWLLLPLLLMICIYFTNKNKAVKDTKKVNYHFNIDSNNQAQTIIPKSFLSPFDTLSYNPLILFAKSKKELLRLDNQARLRNVLPLKFIALSKEKEFLFSIRHIKANAHKLVVSSKGSIEKEASSEALEVLKNHLPALITPIQDYGYFDFKLEQHFSWNYEEQQYDSDYQTITLDIDELLPQRIHHNFYAQLENYSWEGEFDSLAIFQELIPGHYLAETEYNDDMQAIFWQCDSCPINQEFCDYFDTIPVAFPYKAGVQSRYQQTLSFKNNKGISQKMICFSSGDELDYTLSGRFHKAFSGIALLEQKGTKWILKHFNPTVNYWGMFQSPPHFKLLTPHTKQNLFIAEDYIGGLAAVHYSDTYLYSFINGHFQEVLKIPISTRDQHKTAWNSIVSSSNSSTNFPKLEVLIRGQIDTADLEGWDLNNLVELSPKLAQAVSKNKAFNFSIVQHYYWNKEKAYYIQKEEEITITNLGA